MGVFTSVKNTVKVKKWELPESRKPNCELPVRCSSSGDIPGTFFWLMQRDDNTWDGYDSLCECVEGFFSLYCAGVYVRAVRLWVTFRLVSFMTRYLFP